MRPCITGRYCQTLILSEQTFLFSPLSSICPCHYDYGKLNTRRNRVGRGRETRMDKYFGTFSASPIPRKKLVQLFNSYNREETTYRIGLCIDLAPFRLLTWTTSSHLINHHSSQHIKFLLYFCLQVLAPRAAYQISTPLPGFTKLKFPSGYKRCSHKLRQ
ncbi:hypothetical protein BGZ60DRAFT_169676 [Tricladium varicosporioides]|nr:hypothetical protein BGZ60DRAFT_169676 [Hymenoscyphus varicosporioides]